MSAEFYRIAHIVGVLMLFLGLGGMFAFAGKGKASALYPILHGLGLLVMIVAGIGQAHKLGYGWPTWMILKIGCWVVIAVLPTLAKKNVLPAAVALLLALVLGGTAVWLAVTKPI
ncbi:MAG: hypothetical protein KDE27_05165 [Planctomycetes bacterium]|nr:hypothetical protein [Planctomycetota bacterium]